MDGQKRIAKHPIGKQTHSGSQPSRPVKKDASHPDPGAGSSRAGTKHAPDSRQLPGASPKKKQNSGPTTPRDSSPDRDAQESGQLTPVTSKQFIQEAEPSFPPAFYELDSTGNFIPEPADYQPTANVITEPPVLSGFGFSATDVMMAVQCAQVQGIIAGTPGRLRPPPGIKVPPSWLLKAIVSERLRLAAENAKGPQR